MSAITFFNQTCPVCGRGLQIAVDLLGQQVACRHCRGRFIANDASFYRDPIDFDISLLEQADQLIANTSGSEGREAPRMHRSRDQNSRKFGH